MEDADAPTGIESADEAHQCPRSFWKFKAVQQFKAAPSATVLRRGWKTTANHVTEVNLGQFVVAEIKTGEALLLESIHEMVTILCSVHLHADENVG